MQRAWNEFFTIEVRQEPTERWIVRIAVDGREPGYLAGNLRDDWRLIENTTWCKRFDYKWQAMRTAKKYCKQEHRRGIIEQRAQWIKV